MSTCVILCVSIVVSYLFLVPFEVGEKDKANVWVWIFINYSLSFCLLLQDVVHPLTLKTQS